MHQLADLLRQNADTISRVQFFDEIAFAASGGTVCVQPNYNRFFVHLQNRFTATEAIFNRAPYKAACGFDPLMKVTCL